MIILKRLNFFFLVVFLIFSLSFSAISEVFFPEYNGNPVTDLTGKLSPEYQDRLAANVGKYEVELRILFIDGKDLNLGIYAAKLFDRWQMPEKSILVVIDPYTNKVGYGVGKAVRDQLKNREYVKVDNKGNEQKLNQEAMVDYENLTEAIVQKFTLKRVEVAKNGEKKKSEGQGNSSYKYLPPQTPGGNYEDQEKGLPKRTIDFKFLWFPLLLIVLSGIGALIFRNYKEKKRLKDLHTAYELDGEVLSQDLQEMFEKIKSDLEKMQKFTGKSREEMDQHLKMLEKEISKVPKIIEDLNEKLLNLSLENIDETSSIIEKASMRLGKLEKLHKESVVLRKEFKLIQDKSAMTISDIRVNLENCRNLLEEIKLIYSLELTESQENINKCEKMLTEANNKLINHDPIEFINNITEIQKKIKDLKNDFEVIPHLQQQLQEDIPVSISKFIEESVADKSKQNRLQQELDNLRNKALNDLKKGNMTKSQESINKIFAKLDEIRNLSEIA